MPSCSCTFNAWTSKESLRPTFQKIHDQKTQKLKRIELLTIRLNRTGKKINAEILYHCSFQILPVTLSFNSFRSPPEKKRAMLRWMMRPSKLSRTFLWLSLTLLGTPCQVIFLPFPPTSRL